MDEKLLSPIISDGTVGIKFSIATSEEIVDKHASFKGSRCFYVVSIDGSRADFSYIKCMENFVKVCYPEHADSFNRKYFRKRHA